MEIDITHISVLENPFALFFSAGFDQLTHRSNLSCGIAWCVRARPCPKSGRLLRSWWRTSSATAGSRGRTRTGRYRELRALRSDLIDPAVADHHGQIVKRTGDGLIAEFRSVVEAVRCAIAMQNGLIERNVGMADNRRIDFRIGIHLGDVVEEADGDLMGDGVNIAARLEGIAKPRAICLSEDAYRQVKGRLGLTASDLGLTQLKNIAEPIRVYSLQVGEPAQEKVRAERAGPSKSALVQAALGALARTHGDAPSDRHLNRISCCCCVWGAHFGFCGHRHTPIVPNGESADRNAIGVRFIRKFV